MPLFTCADGPKMLISYRQDEKCQKRGLKVMFFSLCKNRTLRLDRPSVLKRIGMILLDDIEHDVLGRMLRLSKVATT